MKILEDFKVVYMHPQAHGFSRKKDILAMAGLSTPNVLDWFRGYSRPGTESLKKIATFLEDVKVVDGLFVDPLLPKRKVGSSEVDPKAVLARYREDRTVYRTGYEAMALEVGAVYRFTFLNADGRTAEKRLSKSKRVRFVGKVLGEFPRHYLLQVGGHKECLLKVDLKTIMFIGAEKLED